MLSTEKSSIQRITRTISSYLGLSNLGISYNKSDLAQNDCIMYVFLQCCCMESFGIIGAYLNNAESGTLGGFSSGRHHLNNNKQYQQQSQYTRISTRNYHHK